MKTILCVTLVAARISFSHVAVEFNPSVALLLLNSFHIRQIAVIEHATWLARGHAWTTWPARTTPARCESDTKITSFFVVVDI